MSRLHWEVAQLFARDAEHGMRLTSSGEAVCMKISERYLPSLLTYLLTYLLIYLLTYLLAYLLIYLKTF